MDLKKKGIGSSEMMLKEFGVGNIRNRRRWAFTNLYLASDS